VPVRAVPREKRYPLADRVFLKKEDFMKLSARVITAAAVALLFLAPAWTGALAQPSWEFGLKAGVSATKLTGDAVKDIGYYDHMKVGFVGGGYATMHMNTQFGGLEALYFQKGGKGSLDGVESGQTFSADVTWTLDYFELPLLAVYSIPAGVSGSFDIFAGPALGFKVSSKSKEEWTAGAESGTIEEDINNVKSTDFGGVVGVGFTMGLSSVDLFADARWEWGFTKLDDSEAKADVKNSAFGFMVGVGFPLGKGGGTP
jgi:hypothetical protein